MSKCKMIYIKCVNKLNSKNETLNFILGQEKSTNLWFNDWIFLKLNSKIHTMIYIITFFSLQWFNLDKKLIFFNTNLKF